MERKWRSCEELRGLDGTAVMRGRAGECQADESDDVRYMVFVLKIDGRIGKILKIVNK